MDDIAYIFLYPTISKGEKYILLFSPYSPMDDIVYIFLYPTISKDEKYFLLFSPYYTISKID